MAIQNERFDLIIIGSGPAGYLSAIEAARRGLRIAVIEKGELGGTCLNRGCIPTKTLLDEARHWTHFLASGLVENGIQGPVFYRKILEKKRNAVEQVVSGLKKILGMNRIFVFSGEASFVAPHAIAVRSNGEQVKTIESDHVLIASGAVPAEMASLKMDGERVIGSDEALLVSDLPENIAIVGSGRRGVEFASFFNVFGVSVTLFEAGPRILPAMDREISVRYKGLLTKRGVKVLADARVTAADSSGERGVTLNFLQKGKEEKATFARVLVVGDRRANVDGLEIGRASLSLQNGFLPVSTSMETSSPGVYAAGDVVGKPFAAHKAFEEARAALGGLLDNEIRIDRRFLPLCLYCQPEAASVGLTEEEAKSKVGELNVATGRFPFIGCGRAVTASEQEGMVKIISEKKYGEVLGVHIVGPGATEMIQLGIMAMKNEIGINDIKQMMFAHPTLSEAFSEAALDTSGEAIHIMKA